MAKTRKAGKAESKALEVSRDGEIQKSRRKHSVPIMLLLHPLVCLH